MLPPPLESVYSGVVSLRSIRLIAFIGELNGLSLFQGDISNAYLESYTKELVVFIAGPEFVNIRFVGSRFQGAVQPKGRAVKVEGSFPSKW